MLKENMIIWRKGWCYFSGFFSLETLPHLANFLFQFVTGNNGESHFSQKQTVSFFVRFCHYCLLRVIIMALRPHFHGPWCLTLIRNHHLDARKCSPFVRLDPSVVGERCFHVSSKRSIFSSLASFSKKGSDIHDPNNAAKMRERNKTVVSYYNQTAIDQAAAKVRISVKRH